MGQCKAVPLLPAEWRQPSPAARAEPAVAVARQLLFTGQGRTDPLAVAAIVPALPVAMEGLKAVQTGRGRPLGVVEMRLLPSVVSVLQEEETSALQSHRDEDILVEHNL